MLEQRLQKQLLIDRHNEFMKAVQTLRAQLVGLSKMELITSEIFLKFAPGVETEEERLWLQREVEASVSALRKRRRKVELFVDNDYPHIIRIEMCDPPLLYAAKEILFHSETLRIKEKDNE